ncbi:MAG: DEAD/DEAH box helicase [Bacteroidales bacterium]|jgi:ATP-dependent DNA helicase RecQ|nr:DEAD/DEAH box helicase [Bacteroidales bacterium]
MEISRQQAESTLLKIFGIEHFYDEQWKAINAILQGKRILMIARTGFGKSLCYQYPAVLFDGVTVVFSPLIALMRDQVKSLSTLHISARCINCEESLDDNKKSIEDAIDGKVKILYIAPERQENDIWQEAVRHIKLSMVVVDEDLIRYHSGDMILDQHSGELKTLLEIIFLPICQSLLLRQLLQKGYRRILRNS